jgi:ssRNA-specific RNase YbeY (16S rRNA maturation enzyme)
MFGDIVISLETAARQAEERGYTLLDEIRILMVGFIILSDYFIMFCVELY